MDELPLILAFQIIEGVVKSGQHGLAGAAADVICRRLTPKNEQSDERSNNIDRRAGIVDTGEP